MRPYLFLALISIILFACRKESQFESIITSEKINQQEITSVKNYLRTLATQSSENALILKSVEDAMVLNKGTIEFDSFGNKSIVIPLNPSLVTNVKSENSLFKYLVLSITKQGEIVASEIIEISEPVNGKLSNSIIPILYKNNVSEFSGRVFFSTVSMKFYAEKTFKDGKESESKFVRKKIKNNAQIKTNSSEKIKNNLSNCIDWYWETYIDGVLVDEVYAFTTCSPNDACQAYAIVQENTTIKSMCGGGSSSSSAVASEFREIEDILIFPCFKNTWNLVKSSNLNSNLTKIIFDVFGGSAKFNITIVEKGNVYNSNGDEVIANTTRPAPNGQGGFDFTISLSTSQMENSSKEFIAATIYHELLHAYLRTEQGLTSQSLQHNVMAEKYVSSLASTLQILFPSLSSNHASNLAWGGLTAFFPYQSFAGTVTQNLINLDNAYFQSGTYGTKCL
jgi:hypothetical protein